MDFSNDWLTPMGRALATAVQSALAPFAPSDLDLTTDDGLPWIEVTFDEIVTPRLALALGHAIQQGTRLPVYFHSLSSNTVLFLSGGEFLLKTGERYPADKFEEYGTRLEAIESAWQQQN